VRLQRCPRIPDHQVRPPNNLEKYEGGRDFDSLKKFAEENLKPTCGYANKDLCDADQLAQLEKFLAMSEEELEAIVNGAKDAKAAAEKNFKDEVSKLQKKYEGLMKDKDAAVEAADKEFAAGPAGAALAEKKKAAKDEL